MIDKSLLNYKGDIMEELQDITLTCLDCKKEFVFTVGEQNYYKEHGLENQPKRCKECRMARKQRQRNNFHQAE